MEPASALLFTTAARVLTREARRLGLSVPTFRSPPRLAGADRTLRRRPQGGVVVAVRVRGRPWAAVAADMIEGVIAVNALAGVGAEQVRSRLWAALTGAVSGEEVSSFVA